MLTAFMDWVSDEADRITRSCELSCEAAWRRVVTAVDKQGRTALHYAAACAPSDAAASSTIAALWRSDARADINRLSAARLEPKEDAKGEQLPCWPDLESAADLLTKEGDWFGNLFLPGGRVVETAQMREQTPSGSGRPPAPEPLKRKVNKALRKR